MAGRLRRRVAVLLGMCALGAAAVTAAPQAASGTTGTTLIGAFSSNWSWFDNAVGPVQIYRVFDKGFHYATWQDTAAYQMHPNATAFDYSFNILPQRLADPTDPINAQVRAFLATTPKNIIITDYHEPDDVYKGKFTPAQFRAGILALAAMVRAQNAVDGGTRMTSVVLMNVTFGAYGTTRATDWWPTDARDGGHVDIVEADVYQLPHNTNTACCPVGYTDGINWRKPAGLLTNLYNFAVANNTPWAVAELGMLEDIHDPQHKASSLSATVAWAASHGAHHVSYFDAAGPRADWRLRYASPVGTTSATSNATLMWRSLVAAAS